MLFLRFYLFVNESGLPKIVLNKSNFIGDCDWNTTYPDVEASLDIQYQ